MIPFVNDLNMVQEAQDLTLSQFHDSPLFLGMVNCLITPLQDIQDTLHDMEVQTLLVNAVGYQLDVIGLYVGITRQGFSDDIFRLFIQVKIAINNSQGTPDQIITIMKLITGAQNVLYQRYLQAAMDLQVGVDLSLYLTTIGMNAGSFVALIEKIIPAGVELYGISAYNGPKNAFGFFEDPDALGYDQGEYAYNLYGTTFFNATRPFGFLGDSGALGYDQGVYT